MYITKKLDWKCLLFNLALPLIVGGLAGLLTRNSMDVYNSLKWPPLAPPGWVFPVVWTILYILMGLAAYIVFQKKPENKTALVLYFVQLAVNFIWPLIFFTMQNYRLAFVVLVILWLLVLVTTVLFFKIDRTAGWLMIPYLLWLTFAGYLNLGILVLNG